MRCISIVIFGLILANAAELCFAQVPEIYSDNNLVIYNTHRNARRPLTANQIRAKSNFEPLTDTEFTGDLCLENRHIVMVLRKYAAGPELYYKFGSQYLQAFSATVDLEPNDIESPEQVCRIKFADPTQVMLSTEFETEAGPTITMEYLIRADRGTIEIQSGSSAEKLNLQSVAYHTIIPDLFGDDVVINHASGRTSNLFLPEDNNLFIQLKDNGNAIFVCNWPPTETDSEIELNISRSSSRGYHTETKIDLGNKEKIWLSMLVGGGIWHQAHTSQLNIYNQARLNWIVPFAASWRADYRRSDKRASGLTDSFWNTIMMPDGTFMDAAGLMEMQIIDGQFIISGSQEIKRLVRRSVFNRYIGNGWWPYLGWYIQPFYLDGNRAFMKIPKYDQLSSAHYSGSILIYPLMDDIIPDRAATTVEGVLRRTLGPDYLDILDLADLNKRPLEDYYPPTCFTTTYCENIFEAFEDVPRQRQIISILEQMKLFVDYTRQRIDTYYQWQFDIEELYLDTLAPDDPNLDDPNLIDAVEALDKTSSLLRKRYEREEAQMKTPEHAADLADQIIDLIGNRSFSKITRAKQTGARLRNIGDTQDELLGELRDTLKIVRQRAAVLHTKETDPRVRKFLREVRRRTQTVLRICYDMEGKQTP